MVYDTLGRQRKVTTVKKQVGTISLKPTAEGYARELLVIYANTTSQADRKWAQDEIVKVFTAAAHAGIFDAESEVPRA